MSNVDEFMRKRLIIEMSSILRKFDVPVIYVTHNRREAFMIADRIAVMFDGRFHQIDKADNVFEKPSSKLVAEFMGFENIYDGIVTAVNDIIEIEWSEGTVYAEKMDVDVRDEIEFCIRPEYVMIIREGKPVSEFLEGNVYDGEIVNRLNVGGMFELVVKLKREIVTVLVPDHAYHRLKLHEKDNVKIGFKRNKIHVMKKFQ